MGKGPKVPTGKSLRVLDKTRDKSGTGEDAEAHLPLQGPAHEVALIEELCAFPPIRDSENLADFLRFLYRTRSNGLIAEQLERKFFRRREEGEAMPDGSPDDGEGPYVKPEHARERVKKLNLHLAKFASSHPLAEWICDIPEPIGARGYKLEIMPAPWTASQCLWMDHLRHAKDLIVVSGTHLFFFNKSAKTVFRYTDINDTAPQHDEGGKWRKDLFASVRQAHPDAELEGFEPWANTYLASGDILAFESISKWFYAQATVHIERRTTQDISTSDLLGKTPIYIGRTQTNARIRAILKEPSLSHLRYSIEDPNGIVLIRGITGPERSDLSPFCNVGKDGRVTSKDGCVFALVTRARNPHGHGHITIIACDYYAPAIARVIAVMTDDRWAPQILQKAKWPKRPYLPGSFQMLFRLRVFEDFMHDHGVPELLCAALYDEPLAPVS